MKKYIVVTIVKYVSGIIKSKFIITNDFLRKNRFDLLIHGSDNHSLIEKEYIKTFKRTKKSFEAFDSIKHDNLYRVYPHTLFCDTLIKDRCVTHADKNIFYSDGHHPSLKGAEMINDLIMKEIEKIELKSN